MELYKYNEDFNPLFLEGHTARLFGSGLPDTGQRVKCIGVGAMPEYSHDFGALTAVTWDTDQQTTNLEMQNLELGHFRMRVIDDIKVQLKNSPAVTQWRTLRTTFYLPKIGTDSPEYLQKWFWRASEFFIWEDNIPSFDLYSLLATSEARILFSGWRYRMVKLPEDAVTKFDIWISDWPSMAAAPGA